MDNRVYFTYTCPVSRKTYAGHPRDGYLYTHDNNLEEAIDIIYNLSRKHHQPVTWVINDQEYTNQENLLHRFKQFQQEGDAILVTMELTTSPPGIDKFDTTAVLTWINNRCKEAGLRIDGLWSLRFLETDLQAILTLDPEEFAWTRNLAGSCWHQIGIDDSTWGGCPYNPYYPSINNVRSPAQPGEPRNLVMLEWLSRDIAAILAGGFPATFALDPADSNRKNAGGFPNEPEALNYSKALIMEIARQRKSNQTVVINVNEEARHFQTEGHDKAYMLDGMFGCADSIDGVNRVSYRDMFSEFRKREPDNPERLFVCRSVDPRVGPELAALYEDSECQIGFLRSRGSLPVELLDYSAQYPGEDGNSAYPQENLEGVRIVSQSVDKYSTQTRVKLLIESSRNISQMGFAVWNTGLELTSKNKDISNNIMQAIVGLDECLFIKASLKSGANDISIIFEN